MKIKTREICIYGISGMLIFVLKFIMAALPNIEPVSLLIIVYTIAFGIKAIYPLSIYVILEIVFYGFGIWSIGYMYIWLVLLIATLIVYKIKHSTNVFLWASLSGVFGFVMGALYIPLYIISGNTTVAISWWVSGIPYDIVHGISNFILCSILFIPLSKLMFKLQNTIQN